MPSDRTLVIGDTHGHKDRLQALLEQEGIVKDGKRVPASPQTVHLGDLGHFGTLTKDMDQSIYESGLEWLDLLLWGNHERAVVDPKRHSFGGFSPPYAATHQLMEKLHDEERFQLAVAIDGFLLTHAGLHAWFKTAPAPEETKKDPAAFAAWINAADHSMVPHGGTAEQLINTVSPKRGNWKSTWGGIIWRDASESLYPGFRQIFGHTSGKASRTYQTKGGDSYCIDVSKESISQLTGVWLPEVKFVSVIVDA